MDQIRCLSPDGIRQFARYLKRLREDGRLAPPRHLLTDDRYSNALTLGDVRVEVREFASRRDFVEYIDRRFRAAGFHEDGDEPGMWEWLSLYYIDATCPPDRNGTRKPGVDGRHLMNDQDARRRLRHLLRGPYMLYRQHGPGGQLDLLLEAPLHVHRIASTHIVERPRIFGSPGALAAASRMYFDQVAGKPKRGYSDVESGLRAFCKYINNLPDCFDLAEMSADTVMALLPGQFEKWMDSDTDSEQIADLRDLYVELHNVEPYSDGHQLARKLGDLLEAVGNRALTARQTKVRSEIFRSGVLGAYESRCAISGMELTHATGDGGATYEVESAHIIPVSRGGRDLIQNGVALNRTIHWAFDLGMVWIDASLRVSVSDQVERDQRNAWLKQFRGRPLRLPSHKAHHPHPDALRWHARNVAGVGVGSPLLD